jgi:hypothetical protein
LSQTAIREKINKKTKEQTIINSQKKKQFEREEIRQTVENKRMEERNEKVKRKQTQYSPSVHEGFLN